jgi:hypothetical protein
VVNRLFAKLKFASARDLGISAGLALVAAVVLDRTSPAGGEFFVGVLFGLAVGLGVFALGVWQRGRARG